MSRKSTSREYTDGYDAGAREAHDDRWTSAMVDRYVAQNPARNEFERGYEDGLRAGATGSRAFSALGALPRRTRDTTQRPRELERAGCGAGQANLARLIPSLRSISPEGAEVRALLEGSVADFRDAVLEHLSDEDARRKTVERITWADVTFRAENNLDSRTTARVCVRLRKRTT